MRSLKWALIPYWYLYKKRKLGHRHAQKEDTRKVIAYKPSREDLRRNQPCPCLDLRLPVSRSLRK